MQNQGYLSAAVTARTLQVWGFSEDCGACLQGVPSISDFMLPVQPLGAVLHSHIFSTPKGNTVFSSL